MCADQQRDSSQGLEELPMNALRSDDPRHYLENRRRAGFQMDPPQALPSSVAESQRESRTHWSNVVGPVLSVGGMVLSSVFPVAFVLQWLGPHSGSQFYALQGVAIYSLVTASPIGAILTIAGFIMRQTPLAWVALLLSAAWLLVFIFILISF
jgi:hypothetical protein